MTHDRRVARRGERQGGLFCEFGHRRRAAGLNEKSPDRGTVRLPSWWGRPANLRRRSYGHYFVQTRVRLTRETTSSPGRHSTMGPLDPHGLSGAERGGGAGRGMPPVAIRDRLSLLSA